MNAFNPDQIDLEQFDPDNPSSVNALNPDQIDQDQSDPD